jgi:hypothetical protein
VRRTANARSVLRRREVDREGCFNQGTGLPIFYSPATPLGAEGGFQRFAFIALVFVATCVIMAAAAMVAFNVI